MKDFYWKIRDLLFPQNVIKIRSLSRSWKDTDIKLEEVIVQLFIDFVEIEKPFEQFDTEESPNAAMWAEMKKLYVWWKEAAPKLRQELNELGHYNDILREREIYDSFTEKLCQIIFLREHFWT